MSEAADLVNRWWDEVWNQRKIDVADEILAPDFVVHVFWSNPGLAGPRDVPGIEPTKEVIQLWARAFPDFHVSIEQMIDTGDGVACAHIFHCTSLGEMMGQPPTGKTADMPGLTMMRVRDGKISEAWTCWDMLGGLQQLEMFPPLGAAGPLGMAKFVVKRMGRTIRYKRGKAPVAASDGKPAEMA